MRKTLVALSLAAASIVSMPGAARGYAFAGTRPARNFGDPLTSGSESFKTGQTG